MLYLSLFTIINHQLNLSKETLFISNFIFQNEFNHKEITSLNHESIVKICSKHLILPLFYSLIKKNKMSNKFPKDFIDYAKFIFNINKNRNEILLKELEILVEILNKNSIRHTLLKGASNLVSGIYNNIGERMIGDIDILVDNNQKRDAYEVLKRNGYDNIAKDSFFETRHLPRQINPRKLFAVELHTNILRNNLLKTDEILSQKKIIKKFFVPSFNDQFLINIYNYQINDFGTIYLNYNFKNLYDSYLLLKKLENLYLLKWIDERHFANYFMSCRMLKIKGIEEIKVKAKLFDRVRYKFSKKSKLFSKYNNFILLELFRLKERPKQIFNFFTNEHYRKHIMTKNK